jgi:glutamate-1-semialdehyde 2,1-aminomutase
MSEPMPLANRLPDGLLTAVSVPGREKVVIAHGLGANIWDVDGNQYLDLLMGSGAALLGHANPEIVAAIEAQAHRGTTFYALTEPALELADKIVGHYPGSQVLQYCSTGSDAVFFALRLARMATGRQKVLKFEGGFHGSSDYALMSAFPRTPAHYPVGEPNSGGIPTEVGQTVLIAPYNDLASCKDIVDQFGPDIAAILVEPFQRNIPPEPGFLSGLRGLASSCGACLIFDEVVTGFRLGLGGAAAMSGVTPDIATLGKAIGGGLPLAAVAGVESVMSLASPARGADGFAYCSGTLSGNPLAAAAGLTAISILERPGTFENLFAIGDSMRDGLAQAFLDAGIEVQPIGIGPLLRILPTGLRVTDYRTAATADMSIMSRLATALFELGVYFTGDKAYTSVAHTETDVDQVVEATRKVLQDTSGLAP